MPKERLPIIFFVVAALVWVYLILRAWLVPPVHDEAATFFHYINHGQYMPGYALFDANNHVLNSFLGKYFVKVFGVSAFSIRMANLFTFPVYSWFLYQLSKKLLHKGTQYALLLTGVLMHGFVEYFAYSRGYGMSMAFLMGAIYYSYCFFSGEKRSYFVLAFAFYWLATLSNLTLQNTALLFLAMAFLYGVFIKKQKPSFFMFWVMFLMALFPFVYLSLKMKEGGLLYYAHEMDFWEAVIISFTQQYFDSSNIFLYLFWFVWTGLFVWLLVMFLAKNKSIRELDMSRLFLLLLFLGNIVGVFAMHFILGVNYPSDRTGMHLVLFLFIACVFLADTNTNSSILRYTIWVPSLVFIGQFAFGANLSHSTYWKGEHLPKRFVDYVQRDAVEKGIIPTVGGYKMKELVWAFYNFRNGGVQQNMQPSGYYSGFEEYQLFFPYDFDNQLYDSLDVDNISGTVLARRKEFLQTESPYVDTSDISTFENYSEEYFNLFETFRVDSFVNHAWLLDAELKLYSLETPPKINLVASFFGEDGNMLGYERYPLPWLKKEFRPEDEPMILKLWLYHVPPETKRIVVYLWNIDKRAYTLQNAAIKISKVKSPPLTGK